MLTATISTLALSAVVGLGAAPAESTALQNAENCTIASAVPSKDWPTSSVCVRVKGKGLKIDSFYGNFTGVQRTCNPSLKWIVFDTNNRIQYQSKRTTRTGCYFAGGGYGKRGTYKAGRACVELWTNGVFRKRSCINLY